jgi:hypothetical protein
VLKNEIAAAQLQFFIKQNSANLVTYIAVSGAAANSRVLFYKELKLCSCYFIF